MLPYLTGGKVILVMLRQKYLTNSLVQFILVLHFMLSQPQKEANDNVYAAMLTIILLITEGRIDLSYVSC